MALQSQASVGRALAVLDDQRLMIGSTRISAFHGRRLPFVAANLAYSFGSDLVFYDFPGTARAHRIIGSRKPYYLWVHGLEIWPPGPRRDYARAIRGASAVFANSRHTLDKLSETVPGLANTHLCWLGTEYDDPPVSHLPRRNTVLFVGRNDEMFAKGQDLLIALWPDVVAEIPDAKLQFVGGGTHLDHLRSVARASPTHASIEISGALPDRRLNEIYAEAKLFAMPSEIEGFGLVYVEAMSHGVPIITSTNDASQELNLDGMTGYAIDRGDKARLVDRIVAILRDPDLHRRLSDGAVEHWRRNFTFSAFSRRFWQAMAAAAAGNGRK
jgi:phosphatidylinositol alpha-1,6-mannosyltransferase